MPLNKIKSGSQMYQGWITHTWNPLGGECYNDCAYCYVNGFKKRFPNLKNKYSGEQILIESELKTNLGKNNFIFVCSQNDLFSSGVNGYDICKIMNHCIKYPDNKYLFQTKTPGNMRMFLDNSRVYNNPNFIPCVTIETNRYYGEYMGDSPAPFRRGFEAAKFKKDIYLTLEPLMDFDKNEFISIIKRIGPIQVNIGANTNKSILLPEPNVAKTKILIAKLREFVPTVHLKMNLQRLLK